jgi:transposase-like protein
MAWGTVNVDEQRMRFVVCASRREKTMQQLCEEFEISRPTGYQWLRRYQAGGIAGVVEKSRRPQQSPTQTASELEERVVELRQQRPDWGARKLQVLLADEGIHLPVITVHRILLRRGLVRVQDQFRTAVGAFRARRREPVVADGFQGAGGMGRAGGATVGAGRS